MTAAIRASSDVARLRERLIRTRRVGRVVALMAILTAELIASMLVGRPEPPADLGSVLRAALAYGAVALLAGVAAHRAVDRFRRPLVTAWLRQLCDRPDGLKLNFERRDVTAAGRIALVLGAAAGALSLLGVLIGILGPAVLYFAILLIAVGVGSFVWDADEGTRRLNAIRRGQLLVGPSGLTWVASLQPASIAFS